MIDKDFIEQASNNPKEQLRIQQEELQSKSLFESISAQAGVEMSIESEPAKGEIVTGDFYRVFQLDHGQLCIFVGDIENHGIEAATASVDLHTFMDGPEFREFLTKETEPSEILKFIDNTYKPRSRLGITLANILIDPKNRKIKYANAGVPYLYIHKADGLILKLNSRGGFITDEYAANNSGTVSAEISPRDTVILVTDGIKEARDKNGLMIFSEELLQKVGEKQATTPKDFTRGIMSQISSSITVDDATVLAFRILDQQA